MAETSKSQVTITLGRGGQVVKRTGPTLDISSSESHTRIGKRSVKDRLGGFVDETIQLNNKRQRGEGNRFSLNAADDMLLGKDDLRFKISQKKLLKGSQSNDHQHVVDLREKLSRRSQHTMNSLSIQQHTSEQKDTRWSIPESKDFRQLMPMRRDVGQYRPEPKDARQYRPEAKDVGKYKSEPKDFGQYMSEPKDVKQYRPESKDVRRHISEGNNIGILGRSPSIFKGDNLVRAESLRNSYSPWTLDRLRQRSPDGISGASRGLSPQRIEDERQRRPVIRTYDDMRSVSYMREDVHELSRPMSSASFMSKSIPPVAPMKPLTPLLAPPLPLGSVTQRSSYAVEEQLAVDRFLHSLGLEKYEINFKAEEVDMHALRQMGDIDLKELGIPLGPRKKILLALLPRSTREA